MENNALSVVSPLPSLYSKSIAQICLPRRSQSQIQSTWCWRGASTLLITLLQSCLVRELNNRLDCSLFQSYLHVFFDEKMHIRNPSIHVHSFGLLSHSLSTRSP